MSVRPSRSSTSIDIRPVCTACEQREAEEIHPVTLRVNGGETTTSIGLCRACLDQRLHRRRSHGLLILALLWLPALTYCYAVYRNDTLDPYWKFAGAAPAVLIALYLSAFFYDWVLNAFRASGRKRTGAVWAQKLARRIRPR